jgi:hypothetical protein
MSTDHAYVIVPYRAKGRETARKEQLDNLIPYLSRYFAEASLPYTVIVVEQNDETAFNRGRLLNIGTIEAKTMFKDGERNIIIHSNVDVVPKKVDFRMFETGLTNVCGWWDGSGSMCVMDIESYYSANGFPNDLAGWGAEDYALKYRCVRADVPFHVYNHHNDTDYAVELENPFCAERGPMCWRSNEKNTNEVSREFTNNTWRSNGVTSCAYTVTDKQFNPDLQYYHMWVTWDTGISPAPVPVPVADPPAPKNGWNMSDGRITFTRR